MTEPTLPQRITELEDYLSDLLAERNEINNHLTRLKESIKTVRSELVVLRRVEKKNKEPKKDDSYEKLQRENKHIRQLFALQERANGKTYKEISTILDISIGRAQQIVKLEERRLRLIDKPVEDV